MRLYVEADEAARRRNDCWLTGTNGAGKRKPGRPASTNLPSNAKAALTLSPEARAKIAAAQKARWAKSKKSEKREVRNAAAVASLEDERRCSKGRSVQEDRLREEDWPAKVEGSSYSRITAFWRARLFKLLSSPE